MTLAAAGHVPGAGVARARAVRLQQPFCAILGLSPAGSKYAMAYARPPITEAVIELRFANLAEQAAIEAAGRRLRGDYFYHESERIIQFKLNFSAQQSEPASSSEGIKLSSLDRADSVFFRPNTLLCSRLAPYTGWEEFFGRTVKAWEVWRKSADHTPLSRVGVRYINRIDVPVSPDTLVQLEDYLNVYPKSPDEFTEPIGSFAMQIVRPLGVDDCTLALNTATVVPPLIGFGSLALDLDVFREANLPRRDEDLWDILNRMRALKNRIFESCITDRARALFG